MVTCLSFQGIHPVLDESVFVCDTVRIIGDVTIGSYTNIWHHVTIRGDVNQITIGKRTNIQDGTVCHVTRGTGALSIGDEVTIGHHVTLHGCTLMSRSFVGMSATVMDGAIVETHSMVAAGALVTPGKVVKSGELWAGSPAKFFRKLTDDEITFIGTSAQNYCELSDIYRAEV